MSLTKDIQSRIIVAMKARDAEVLSSYRMLSAAFKNAAIEKRVESIDDKEALVVLGKELKKLKDSLSDFTKAGREELATKTSKEIELLSKFMPEQMSEEDVRTAVKEVIASVENATSSDFGRIMGDVMKKVKGLADGGLVTRIVKEELFSS